MSERGKLIVISGFSGVGKGTVIKKLMDENPGFVFSVSATTRYMREGEINGVHYFFITREEFEKGIEEGRFLEYAQYSGNYYGTPRDYILSQMEMGNNVILDIECQGAFQVKERMPEAKLIFMMAPSMQTLYNRLTGRGTETAEQIRTRMEQTDREVGIVEKYDVILINDQLDQTVENILEIIRDPEAGSKFYEENLGRLETAKSQIKDLLKNI